MASQAKSIIFLLTGLIFIPPCLFFTYYTARLVYLNLTMEDAAAHRNFGMFIGAVVFPIAAIVFGFVSWFLVRKAVRGFRK